MLNISTLRIKAFKWKKILQAWHQGIYKLCSYQKRLTTSSSISFTKRIMSMAGSTLSFHKTRNFKWQTVWVLKSSSNNPSWMIQIHHWMRAPSLTTSKGWKLWNLNFIKALSKLTRQSRICSYWKISSIWERFLKSWYLTRIRIWYAKMLLMIWLSCIRRCVGRFGLICCQRELRRIGNRIHLLMIDGGNSSNICNFYFLEF